jgi:hypothetical protein
MYLLDGNAVGIRFRYVRKDAEGPEERSFQIVGVVRDFPAFPPNLTRSGEPTIYHPAAVGNINPVTLSVRAAGAVTPEFINRFRAIGAEVDPAMQLQRVGRLSDQYDEGRSAWRSMSGADRAGHGQRAAAVGRRNLRVDVISRSLSAHGRLAFAPRSARSRGVCC